MRRSYLAAGGVAVVAALLIVPVAEHVLRSSKASAAVKQSLSTLLWAEGGLAIVLLVAFPPMSLVPGL